MSDLRATDYTNLNGADLSRTLGRQLIDVVDMGRDLVSQFGLRPYEVHLVRTAWTGGERGQGEEFIVSDLPLLPTPKVADMSALRRELTVIGVEENGELMVSELSGRFSEGLLTGRDDATNPPEPQQQFYWEIRFPTPGDASGNGIRRRFVTASAPTYDPMGFQWRVTLTRAHPERRPDGGVR